MCLIISLSRHNIDPAGVKTDDQLWKALEIAQLKEVVSPLEGGLGKWFVKTVFSNGCMHE